MSDVDTLQTELSAEFTLARMNLLRAQIQLERRDSPDNRKALGAAVEEVDAVLDLYLDARGECE